RPALRTDDAHGHCLADAERVAHREDNVAHTNAVGVAKGKRVKIGRVDLDERQIARLVGADYFRVERAAVAQFDADLVRAVDDVVVGQNVAVGRRNDARSEAALLERRRTARSAALPELVAEELTEEVVVRQLEL